MTEDELIFVSKNYMKLKEVQEKLLIMLRNSTLPPYFEPVKFEFKDQLPLTDIGKVDYIALQQEETLEENKKIKQLKK